ncbi:MAG: hypothetical protein ABH867_02945 [Patescibacteria group bacterium]|nr:hypothetical protein [Patescibacteria group bacterium]
MKKNKQTRGKTFRVGDKIIDAGQVYRIFKIEEKEDAKNGIEKVIYFRLYYKTERNRNLVCSIPVKNIDLACIRKPISKDKMKKLLKKLSEKEAKKEPVNPTWAKEQLRLNRVGATARILKRLSLEKQDESTNFTGNNQNLLDLSIERLVEEIAFVLGISVAQASEKIKKALWKGSSVSTPDAGL